MVLPRDRPRGFDHVRIVRGDGGIVAFGDHRLQHPRIGGVDVRLALIGDRFRFLVRALHQAHASAERVDLTEIVLAAVERALQHDANLPVAEAPQGLEDLERHLRVPRVFHVDAHEETCRLGALENLPEIVDGDRLVDVEAQLREFERDVAPDPGRDHRVDHREVVARRGVGLVEAGDALAEQVECRGHAARFDGSCRLDRFGDGLAGDEPPRETRRLAHPVARGECLEGLALSDEVKKYLRGAIEHQCVRPGVMRRCSIERA